MLNRIFNQRSSAAEGLGELGQIRIRLESDFEEVGLLKVIELVSEVSFRLEFCVFDAAFELLQGLPELAGFRHQARALRICWHGVGNVGRLSTALLVQFCIGGCLLLQYCSR